MGIKVMVSFEMRAMYYSFSTLVPKAQERGCSLEGPGAQNTVHGPWVKGL